MERVGHCATVRLEREIVYHDNLQHLSKIQ